MIPKAGGKLRRLGIPTVADRVVQASLKLVLEPIFEADFLPCSYGFRPKRRAHDAVAEVRFFATRPRCYEWIVEGDIKACFDEISHPALMDRVRRRVGDKRVLALVKAFLKAGILTEERHLEDTTAGTPQGGILSPLLANVALSVLDEYIARAPGGPSTGKTERARRLRHGLPNFRLVRYADDWCLMVKGTRADAEALQEQIAVVLATMGLRLSPDKTLITHIDEGLDFLGWRIQRHRKRGTSRYYVYTYPSKKAVQAAMRKVKTMCRQVSTNQPLDDLLRRLNATLRGWAGLFPGRGVLGDLLLPQPLHVAHGMAMDAPQTPQIDLETPPPAVLRRRMVASRGRDDTDRSVQDRHDPIPLPRLGHPVTLAGHRDEEHHDTPTVLWRARCIERCTPGSGSGPEKRNSRKAVTALRADFRSAGSTAGPGSPTAAARGHLGVGR